MGLSGSAQALTGCARYVILSMTVSSSGCEELFLREPLGCRLKAVSFRSQRYLRIDRSRAPKTFSASTISDSQLECHVQFFTNSLQPIYLSSYQYEMV